MLPRHVCCRGARPHTASLELAGWRGVHMPSLHSEMTSYQAMVEYGLASRVADGRLVVSLQALPLKRQWIIMGIGGTGGSGIGWS